MIQNYFADGLPIVCGGYPETGYASDADDCYKYSPSSDSWQLSGTMPDAKAFSAYAYVQDFGLVMAGGDDGNSASVTVTRDGINFEELTSLPAGNYAGCLTAVDEQTLMYTGGEYDYYAAYSYDIPSDTWTT